MGVLTSIPREAIKGTGGLQYVLVSNFDDVSTSIDSSTGIATFDPSSNSAWKKYVPRKESSNFTETETGTPASGITSYNQVLTLVFAYNQSAKRNELKVLGQSEVRAVAVDRNGNAWLLGAEFGLDLTSGTIVSGTVPTDMNGMTVILAGNEREPMAIVPAATLTLITP
jgi:hypothetical protein